MITYFTSLKIEATEEPVMLSFALGADMSTDTITGLSFIKQMKLELRFDPEAYLLHILKKQFDVAHIHVHSFHAHRADI